MKKVFLCLFVVMCLDASALTLNEVMCNPEEGGEWIELFTNDRINLSEFYFMDNYQTDTFDCCGEDKCNLTVSPNSSFLVLEQDNTFSKENNSIYYCVDDKTLGNGLGNKGDKIIIYTINYTHINHSYSVEVPRGKSLSLVNGSWEITDPTPEGLIISDKKNFSEPKFGLSFILPKKLFTGFNYDSLFKIKNLNYPEYKERIEVYFFKNISKTNSTLYREQTTQHEFISYTTKTGPIYFNQSGKYTLCGEVSFGNLSESLCVNVTVIESRKIPCKIYLKTNTDKEIYEEGETVKIQNNISNETFPFEIEYWVEDLFGQTIKSKINTKNTNLKRFTPKIEGIEKVFVVKSILRDTLCNNSHESKINQNIIAVKGKKVNESLIDILNVYSVSRDFVFGTPIKARLQVYKGETNKNSIKGYVEKNSERVSYTTYFNVYENYRKHELTLPIQLKKDCKYETGTYTLVVEGLDTVVSKEIEIENLEECNTEKKKEEKTPEVEILFYTANTTTDKVFSVIKLFNKYSKPKNYTVWSYVYRGSKSYSGERELNKKTLVINNNTEKTVALDNTLLKTEEGEYNLKIKAKREDRKTPIEIIEKINVIKQKENKLVEEPRTETENKKSKITSNVIYQSSSEKSKKYLPFLVFFVVLLIILAVIKLKKTR